MKDVQQIIDTITTKLTEGELPKPLLHKQRQGVKMPSIEALTEVVSLTRSIVFPGYFGNAGVNLNNMKYYIALQVERLYGLLAEQVLAGLCFHDETTEIENCHRSAEQIAAGFIQTLPRIREQLTTDVFAAYRSDPAAKSYGEVIFCYPAIKAISNYRIAHELLRLGVPIIPRIITEMAHSETGIDIHPGAQIGEYFTIDHGTGVVIGETAIIGKNVKLYQGVTLGAKSFPLDSNGNPIKGIARHPILEDNVIVYSNASILGRITIGHDAIIGGNIWIENDVPPHSKVLQRKKQNPQSD